MKKFLFIITLLLMLLPSCTEVEHYTVSCELTYNVYYPGGKVVTKTETYNLTGYYDQYINRPETEIAHISSSRNGDYVYLSGYGAIERSKILAYEIVDYKLIKGNLHHITHELK